MHIYQKISTALVGATLACLISSAILADCGAKPEAPELPDGSTATMDDLVAGSKAVNAYIASADAYLDCREAEMATEEFASLSKKEKKVAKRAVSDLTKRRNEIGDLFNAEVAAYQKANPK